MKITLDINDIDYGALVEVFLPMVHDKLAEKDGTGTSDSCKDCRDAALNCRKDD